MKIDILTLFPNMYDGFLSESIIKRAIDNKKVDINLINFRDFTEDKHNKVDDSPYGGGRGMVLMCDPIFKAVEKVKKKNSKVILMSPQGKPYNQEMANRLSKEKHLIFICGHYEGFDERISSIVDEEISIGDYVLTGGELPSMVVTDSIIRLIPGVIEEESFINESFYDEILDYPTYTKPREYRGMKVPEVLLSGDHKKIDEWRKEEAIKKTKERRPDLIKNKEKKKIEKEVKEKSKKEKIIKKIGDYTLIDDRSNKKLISINLKDSYNFLPNDKIKKSDLSSISKVMIIEPTFINKLAKSSMQRKLEVLFKQIQISLNDGTDDEGDLYVLSEIDKMIELLIKNYAKYLGIDYIKLVEKRLLSFKNEINMKRALKAELIDFSSRGRKR